MSHSIDFELIDIPIEFKEINKSDFDSRYYHVEDKIVIEPNDEGFISESLLPILHKGFDEKNTVVINAGVGQGKSKGIIELAERYTQTGNHIVVIAVPYNNLIEQYVAECSFVPDYEVFNFLNIEKDAKNFFKATEQDTIDNRRFPISTYKVHILTVNGLLGNSGEDSLFQARVKATYFQELQDYCTKHKKKLVIIFDEIHDSIHNFKEDLIVNLWNYQGLIHKIITVSATYNEASKEVIKYMSELTDRKIQIIESKRTIPSSRKSKLKIYFYSGLFIERDKMLMDVMAECLKKPELLDIMSYSKHLVKKFLSKPAPLSKFKEVNQILHPHRDLINKCYADPFDKKANQKFEPKMLNIGTNFTTGTNIEKNPGHNYIVILPKEITIEYFNNKGIFTNGANSVIQTLARQRKPGTIHVFMPKPALISMSSLKLSSGEQEKFSDVFNKCAKPGLHQVAYTNINQQKFESVNAYNLLARNRATAIERITNTDRTGMNRLEFYPFELFSLYKAEKHLTQKFFGGNLSSFILWSALCSQFLNCKLESLKVNPRLDLKSKNLHQDIETIYKNELAELDNFSFYKQIEETGNLLTSFHHNQLGFSIAGNLSPYELWNYFDIHFLNTYDLFIDNERINEAQLNQIKIILLGIISKRNPKADKQNLYYHFLKSSIYFSKILNFADVPENFLSDKEQKTIELFKKWYEFVELLEKLKEKTKKDQRLSNTAPDDFIDLFESKTMMEDIKEISSVSNFLSSGMFPFKDTFGKIKKSEQMAASFYSLMIRVLYNGQLSSSTKEGKPIRFYKLEEISFEKSGLTNLLHRPLPEVIL